MMQLRKNTDAIRERRGRSALRGAPFFNALRGFVSAVRTEPHMRFHVFAGVCVIFFGWVVDLNILEWCFVCVAVGVVWLAELLNTAIEKTLDCVDPEYNPLVGRAKDVAAAAVLVSAIMAAVIGCLIFVPKFDRLF